MQESCSKWIHVECFDGDEGKHCEECIEGDGTSYNVTWTVPNKTLKTFQIRWGSASFVTVSLLPLITANEATESIVFTVSFHYCFESTEDGFFEYRP